jgi:hypothetical protein
MMIRSAKMNAMTPRKLIPPCHSTSASGTFPIEQTKPSTEMTGPITGPHSLAASGWPVRNRRCQNESGTHAPTAPAIATALSVMRWRQDYHLFIIGAVAFTAATIGYQHRHRRGGTGHIAGMGLGYTAMLTAFYVDNGPRLPLWHRLPVLMFWLLPGAIATPLIVRAVIRARRTASMPPVRNRTAQTWRACKPGGW